MINNAKSIKGDKPNENAEIRNILKDFFKGFEYYTAIVDHIMKATAKIKADELINQLNEKKNNY